MRYDVAVDVCLLTPYLPTSQAGAVEGRSASWGYQIFFILEITGWFTGILKIGGAKNSRVKMRLNGEDWKQGRKSEV